MIGTSKNLAWRTHEESPALARSIGGTCLQGDVLVPYATLLIKFGAPMLNPTANSSAEWVIEFATPDGTVLAVLYDHTPGAQASDRFHECDWHIGGFGSDARDCVLQALWDVIGVQPDQYEERAAA